MALNTQDIIVLILGALVTLAIYRVNAARRAARLPPGPKGKFFFGNIHQIPRKRSWLKYAEWRYEYGDIMHVNLLNRPFIFLQSKQAIDALFNKRSTIYSDRPGLVVFERAGWTWSLPGLRYGAEMALHRRLLNTGLSVTAVRNYTHDLQLSSLKCAENVTKGSSWGDSLHHMIGSNVLKMTYGYTVQEKDDPWMERAERILDLIQDLGPLGSHPVDIFPFLAVLPFRVWGKKLDENLKKLSKVLSAVYQDPYNEVKRDLDQGKDRPCFTSSMITTNEKSNGLVENEAAIRGTAATNYTVGVETVESTLNTFVIAMMKFPDVQKRAQAELDEYLGRQRLPTYEDRPNLPYIEAILMETMRWQPATPMAVARKLLQDDEYNGYLIPKGSTVIANSWQCLHDPEDYPNPHAFLPDRFIKTSPFNPDPSLSPPDPRDFGFGYGRRACPGRPFAEAQLFVNMATMLSLFDFKLPVDEKGQAIEPDMDYESGVAVQFPKPFKSDLKIRDKVAQDLLENTLDVMRSSE